MQSVSAQPLTQRAFRDFGVVIEARDPGTAIAINAGTCLKFERLAEPDCHLEGGRPVVHIFRATPLPRPVEVKMFERHLLGTQAFIPLDRRPYLVVAVPPGRFDIQKAKVFRASGDQGIQFHRGTWHHFCLALEADSDFLVIDRDGSLEDCEELELPEHQRFVIDQ